MAFVADDPCELSGPLLDLKRNQCKYPTPLHQPGDSVTIFCGRLTLPGKSWCKGHALVVGTSWAAIIRKAKAEDKHGLNKAPRSSAE